MSEIPDRAAAKTSATDDWLGYGAYADALWARVLKALDKDNATGRPLGDDPLVVGLFGEWGAGKSHLLKLIYEQAQQQSARDIAERVFAAPSKKTLTVTVPVMFQPWKYEHEEHLHVAVAAHVRDALDEAWAKLPTDFEDVKELAVKLAEKAEEVAKKISTAKKVFTTLKGGLDLAKTAVETNVGGFVTASVDTLLAVGGVPPVLSGLRSAMMKRGLASEDDQDDQTEDGEGTGATGEGKSKTKAQAVETTKRPTKAEKATAALAHTADGFGFYRVDKFLRAMTRPTHNKKLLDASGMSIGIAIEFDLHINFVVFVDDLDRCLPEKAVQMLELIKTVFNIESFAFVLALDDEVIERGIGHRYQAYNFAGKKPEMPITGFEYLEKIVHVPFRLPALTRYHAEAFVRHYEATVIGAKPEDCWFAFARPVHQSTYLPSERAPIDLRSEYAKIHRVDLLSIALSGFDAFVPRKLVRMVELVHQMSDIARRRERPLHDDQGGDIDIRIVLALAMIQLFQPELYRILRRRVESFPSLLTAFIGEFDPDKQAFVAPASLDAHLSNIDLWRWAIDAAALTAIQASSAKKTVEDFVVNSFSMVKSVLEPGIEPVVNTTIPQFDWSPSVSETEFHYCIAQIAIRHAANGTARANAQLVRLPIVAQIVEHRAAQRHVFDVLKLMRALADSFAKFAPSERALQFAPYLSLLAERPPTQTAEVAGFTMGEVGTVELTVPERDRKRVEVSALADDLLSRESATQANLATRHALSTGEKIGSEALKHLGVELKHRLDKFRDANPNMVDALRTEQRRLLTGLQFLAPFVDRADGGSLWSLVRDSVGKGDPSTSNEPIEPKLRALWGDVGSALGCDDRFDPNNFYLLKDRFEGHHERVEPIPGFVFVPSSSSMMDQLANYVRQSGAAKVAAASFYISRTPVTVDQYALFFEGGDDGYADDEFWHRTDALWRKENPSTKRIDQIRWSEQRQYGARPARGVAWFEARAYARWLNARLRHTLDSASLRGNYEVTLPREAQWERAARALSLTTSDDRRWPWLGDDSDIDQLANVSGQVGGPTAVGLYPPNPIGLYDMAGNVWEWMNNADASAAQADVNWKGNEGVFISRPLRGGSWSDGAACALCSSRELWLAVFCL